MMRFTLTGLLARRWRAVLTGLAAAVGVAIVSGTLVISDTAARAGTGDSNLDLVRQIMLVAGGVALLVGAFIVNITISVTVAQRTGELALLRCLGAMRRQLRRVVLLESLLIGGFGAVVGLLLGFGVAAGLRGLINTATFPGELPGAGFAVTPRTVVAGLLVGVVVTVLSALAPARRAGRVAPLAALRDVPAAVGRGGAPRLVAGAVAIAAALTTVAAAVGTGVGPLLFLAGALILLGVRLLGPGVAPGLASVLGRPVAWAWREPGVLGRHNAMRQPERTAATASAVLIGVALLTFVTVVLGSVRAAMVAEHDRYLADFELRADTATTRMDPALIDRLRATPELATVVAERCASGASVAGEPNVAVCTVEPTAALARVFNLEVVAGSLTDLAPGTIAVNEDTAAARGWTVGSALTVQGPGAAATFTVAAVYRSFYFLGGHLVPPADFARLGGGPLVRAVYLRTAAGVAAPAARAAIDRALADRPGVRVTDRASVRQRNLDQIDSATWVYRALTGLATLIGLFGVVNVLGLAVVERRRELGLLRAVGMDRPQVRSMVRAEAVIIVAVGAATGLGLGVLFGWAAAQVLRGGVQPITFVVPAVPLLVLAAGALAAGLAAATLPARWASRVDVLRAIATE